MNESFTTAILGAGGHAKVVLDALDDNGRSSNSIVVYDVDPHLENTLILRKWPIQHEKNLELGTPLHVAIGDNKTRKTLALKYSKTLDGLVEIRHSKATISRDSSILPGSFIAAGVIIAPDARLGYGVIANHMSIIDHECSIANWVHIAPNVTLGGQVTIHEGSMVGAGAVILPGVTIGAYSIVGAGAVVTRNVPDKEVVYGIPAKSAKS